MNNSKSEVKNLDHLFPEVVSSLITEVNLSFKRYRILTANGRILVGKGQAVRASQNVAASIEPVSHRIVDCSEITRRFKYELRDLLHFQVGDHIEEGDILTGPIGTPKRILRSPVTGVLRSVHKNEIIVLTETYETYTAARYNGIVSGAIPGNHVEISCTGSMIQCMWANGRSSTGKVARVGETNEQCITSDVMHPRMEQQVVFAGTLKDEIVIQLAERYNLAGLVVGTLSPALVSIASRSSTPIFVTDGFGNQGMNPVAYRILDQSHGLAVCLVSPTHQGCYPNNHEIFIPRISPDPIDEGEWLPVLKKGDVVKNCWPTNRGLCGELKKVNGTELLPNGVRTRTADVYLSNDTHAKVPVNNLIKISQAKANSV